MQGAPPSEQTSEELPLISMDLFIKKRGNRTIGRRQGDVTRRFIPPQQTNKTEDRGPCVDWIMKILRGTKLWDEPIRTKRRFHGLPLPD